MRKIKIHQRTQQTIKELFIIVGILGIAVIFYYLLDRRCLFKAVLGIPCPGCGMTRAWVAFLKMDFQRAFKWHPLFWIVPVIVLIPIVRKEAYFDTWIKGVMILLVGLVIGVYIIRMINLFPDQPPMDYNREALIPLTLWR